MSNTNMDNTFIAVPVADFEVEMYENRMSRPTIETSRLGPCVAILIDLSYSGQKYCILDHYNFGLDESKMTSSEIVLIFLEHMMELIKHHVKVSSGREKLILKKTHKLQDSKEREFINCDSHLRAIFDCPRVRFSDLPAKLNKLILPSEPIIINHTLCLGTEPKKHACYDIDVEVDDPVRDSMRVYLSPKNTHELEELDCKILQYIDSINQLKQSREFYLSFADDPQSFICKWLASQSRDLKLIT